MTPDLLQDLWFGCTGIPQDSYKGWAGGDEIGWRSGEPGLNWGYDANPNNFASIRCTAFKLLTTGTCAEAGGAAASRDRQVAKA